MPDCIYFFLYSEKIFFIRFASLYIVKSFPITVVMAATITIGAKALHIARIETTNLAAATFILVYAASYHFADLIEAT